MHSHGQRLNTIFVAVILMLEGKAQGRITLPLVQGDSEGLGPGMGLLSRFEIFYQPALVGRLPQSKSTQLRSETF